MTQVLPLAPHYQYGKPFQFSAVAMALRDPDFLRVYGDVFNPSYFDVDHLHIVASLIHEHFITYRRAPNLDALFAKCSDYARKYGGEETASMAASLETHVNHLCAIPLEDADFIRDRMVAFAQEQALKAAINESLRILEGKNEKEYERVRPVFEKALQVGARRDVGTEYSEVAENITEFVGASGMYDPERKVPFGLATLDKEIKGGIGAGELAVVAGRPGLGKSTLLVNLGKSALFRFGPAGKANGRRPRVVVHVTLELKEADVALMYSALLSGKTRDELIVGSEEYGPRIKQVLDQVAPLYVCYFSGGSITTTELEWFLSNLCMRNMVDIGLLIVDYADLLKDIGGRRGDDTYRGAADVYMKLIQIGDKFGCPVATASQVNREWSYESIVDLRGAADSFLKGANCDIFIPMAQTHLDKRLCAVKLFIAKNRRGESNKTIICGHNGACAYFYEMNEEQVEKYQEFMKEHQTDEVRRPNQRNGGWRRG